MKTYVILTNATAIAGGPIYHKNKTLYMRERGWRVVVFSCKLGKVLLKDFGDVEACPFLTKYPAEFSKRQREKYLEQLIQKIGTDNERVIIETSTEYTAYWGELLAASLNAKHFVFHLDEHNTNITKNEIGFYDFKHKRRELACIRPAAMELLFSGYKTLADDEIYHLRAVCNNVAEECENTIPIPDGMDFYIASIGRLDKIIVEAIVEGICKFADKNPDKKILACFIGDTNNTDIKEKIRSRFARAKNVQLIITGFLYPISKELIDKMDIFVSSAGSARLTYEHGICTISMDVVDGLPIGILGETTNETAFRDTPAKYSVDEYFEQVLIRHMYPKRRNASSRSWDAICLEYDKHMEFINKSNLSCEYYPTDKMKLSTMRKIRKTVIFFLGLDLYLRLEKAISKITH